jgi:putative hydrolase of the HAD superfamily
MQKERIKIKTIIFDLDDTLIKTSKLYNQAREEFSLLMENSGFKKEEALGGRLMNIFPKRMGKRLILN